MRIGVNRERGSEQELIERGSEETRMMGRTLPEHNEHVSNMVHLE
jgi:hypothetical protein